MTRGQVAHLLRKSERTISLWHDQGMPFPEKDGRAYKYDFYEVLQWALANGRIEMPCGVGQDGDESVDYYEERARWQKAKADLAEREVRSLDGQLLKREDVLAQWSDGITALRARIMSLPVKLAPLMDTVETTAEREAIIKNECWAALEEISAHGALPADVE